MLKQYFFMRRGILAALLLCPLLSFAQGKVNFTLKGKVSEGAEPLVGASVVLEGTNIGTLTDVDGNYQLSGSATEGSQNIVISFIGYSTKRQAVTLSNGTATLDVDMQTDALNLSEVLIIGSSVLQEKKQLGNAITTVRADQLSRAGTGNAIQALQGKIAGAQISQNSGDPAGGISVRLRGAKSLLGSSEPLYVIDGVVCNNNDTVSRSRAINSRCRRTV